jgi:hypothetical protein
VGPVAINPIIGRGLCRFRVRQYNRGTADMTKKR